MGDLLGGISFPAQRLPDLLSEAAGYKAGLTLSIEQMCDLFLGTEYADIIQKSEKFGIRLRSEECEGLFYSLLHRIGHTEDEYKGYGFDSARLFHKYKNSEKQFAIFMEVSRLFVTEWQSLQDKAQKHGKKVIDPEPVLRKAAKLYGKVGFEMMLERIEVMDRAQRLSLSSAPRYEESQSILTLDGLFDGNAPPPQGGIYLDQRYINFLYKNPDKLASMHWRKFEELTTEFFFREGYQVELGPGSNDDGVDIRIWNADENKSAAPLFIVQCKRTKSSIEKVVVKGLYADVLHNKAEKGLIVTTSELSPGARSTITSRAYPIQEVNRSGLVEWLAKLRVCGTGIVRV